MDSKAAGIPTSCLLRPGLAALVAEVEGVTLYLQRTALARAGVSEDELIALTGSQTSDAVVQEWLLNLTRPKLEAAGAASRRLAFPTTSYVERYSRMHAEMFGDR
jgi:hypothetical protein